MRKVSATTQASSGLAYTGEINAFTNTNRFSAAVQFLTGVSFFFDTGTAALLRTGLGLAFDGDVTFANLTLTPSDSITPFSNGDLVIEATSNTALTFKFKGSDGTVRSAVLTLS